MSDEYKRGYEDGYRDAKQSYKYGYQDASEVWRNKTLIMEQQLQTILKNVSEYEALHPKTMVIVQDERQYQQPEQ